MEVIKEMAKETTDMVIKSVDAFVNKDLELARWVINLSLIHILDDGNFCRGISGCDPGAVPFLLCKDHPKGKIVRVFWNL